MRRRAPAAIVLACAAAAGWSCRTTGADVPIVQPGAPGQAGRVIDAGNAANIVAVRYTDADVAFMRQMIGHHAQALELTALLRSHTRSEDMRKLAARIDISQADEIAMMRSWLTHRGQALPDPHAHHAPGAALMPGMLSPEEMARVAAARGAELDRLFLEMMIKHHEGALTMVERLLATPGAGQEPEMFAFVSDVDTDQRMEIDRMAVMLKSKELER